MTLGVVDECRRLGLGTKLLEKTIILVNKLYPICEAIYLHVVDYNEAAIKFYKRNNFVPLKRITEHYLIFDKMYDALLLYRDISDRSI